MYNKDHIQNIERAKAYVKNTDKAFWDHAKAAIKALNESGQSLEGVLAGPGISARRNRVLMLTPWDIRPGNTFETIDLVEVRIGIQDCMLADKVVYTHSDGRTKVLKDRELSGEVEEIRRPKNMYTFDEYLNYLKETFSWNYSTARVPT